jgi:hypothetical protein
LIIQGTTLQWDHFDYAAPGRLDGVNEPTIITTTLNGVTQMNGVDWIPTWPYPPPNPIRFPTLSSVFTGLTPTIPNTTDVTLTVINARDSLTIAQMPTASNDYTTLLEFNDDPSAGAAWYEGLLTFVFSTVSSTSGYNLIGTNLPAVSASLAVASIAPGTGVGAGTAPVRIGTTSQAVAAHRPASRTSAAAGAAPRAEIWLAARGRGWGLGTSSKIGIFDRLGTQG